MRSGGFDKVSWVKTVAAGGLKDGPFGLARGEKGKREKSGSLCTHWLVRAGQSFSSDECWTK